MDSLEDISFAYLLQDLTLLLRKHFDRRAARYELTRAQWRALRMLNKRQGISQAELAQLLDMEPIAVGRVIDRLHAAGFVERRAHPGDRRRWQLHLTARAEGVIDGMEQIARSIRRDATRGLERTQLLEALGVIEHMKRNLQALETDAPMPVIEPERPAG